MPLNTPFPPLSSPTPAAAGLPGGCGGGGGGTGGGGGGDAPGCTQGVGNGLPFPDDLGLLTNGTCACLTGDCLVSLWAGGTKSAGEITVGDQLVGPNREGESRLQTVVQVITLVQPTLRVVHAEGEFVCSESHVLVLATGAEMGARCLEPGEDELRSEDGKSLAILRIERVGEAKVFGWTCEPDHVFYAAGLLHHNKASAVPGPVLVQ